MSASRHTQFLVIFLTILLSTIGFGVCIPVLPLYAEQFGASELVNGLLIGAFSLMVMIASPLWGKLSDRVGRRPVLIFSILGSALGYFIMGWAGSLIWLFVARIVDGASGGNVATAQAYIADITTPEQRSKAMGMIGAAFGLGFVIGPAIGGTLTKPPGWHWLHSLMGTNAITWWTQNGTHLPFYFVGLLCVVNAAMVFKYLPESLSIEKRHASHTEQPIMELFSHADSAIFVRVALCYFVCLAAFSIMTAVFALFGWHRFDLDAQHIGYIMALIGIIAVVMQGGVIRRLLPKYGEVKLARSGMAILFVSFVLLPIVGGMTTLLLVSSLIAIGNSLVQPTLNGLASRSVEASWQGRAMGLLQSAASLGRGIGPVLGGFLLHMDVGPGDKPLPYYGRTPFWVSAAFKVATLVLAAGLRLPTGRAATSQGDEVDQEPAAQL
jgi:MFS family permease